LSDNQRQNRARLSRFIRRTTAEETKMSTTPRVPRARAPRVGRPTVTGPRLDKVIAHLAAGLHVFASFTAAEPAAALDFSTTAHDAPVFERGVALGVVRPHGPASSPPACATRA
jgi:hypothetical protein